MGPAKRHGLVGFEFESHTPQVLPFPELTEQSDIEHVGDTSLLASCDADVKMCRPRRATINSVTQAPVRLSTHLVRFIQPVTFPSASDLPPVAQRQSAPLQDPITSDETHVGVVS